MQPLAFYYYVFNSYVLTLALAKFIGGTKDKYQALMDGLDVDIGAQVPSG